MHTYLPEGMRASGPVTSFTPDILRRCLSDGTILELPAAMCDEHHNLHVDLGGIPGIIPRNETAIGIDTGNLRDIAIISRVGKPVCCKITQIGDDGQVVLSRKAAQLEALAYLKTQCRPGDILPAVVTNLTSFGAFCDIGCGLTALLNIENISVSRISHSCDRFYIGQPIYVVLQQIDFDTGRISLTHKELLGTWEENAALFQAGQTVTGVVRSRKDYGVFIELTPNLSGLAEPTADLSVGQCVSVYIKSIQPERMKIKLIVIGKLDCAKLPAKKLHYFQTEGHLDFWQYGVDALVKSYSVF